MRKTTFRSLRRYYPYQVMWVLPRYCGNSQQKLPLRCQFKEYIKPFYLSIYYQKMNSPKNDLPLLCVKVRACQGRSWRVRCVGCQRH